MTDGVYLPPDQLMADLRESIEMTIRAYKLPVEIGWIFVAVPLEQHSTSIRFSTQGIRTADSSLLCKQVGDMLGQLALQEAQPAGSVQ